MKNPSNIAHPLKNRTGTSQRNRVIQALGTDSALIDGKTLADRLYLISEYARQINFYQYKITEFEGESQELDNWSLFFKDSLPFQLAILSKTSIDELETQFLLLYKELKTNPSKESLESLFNFIFNKIIAPTTLLFKTVENNENSFTESLLAIIKTSFSEPIKSFICLYNSSANFLCVTKKNFIDFIKMPWQLKVDEIYALDLCIKNVKKGKKEAFLKAGEVLSIIFQQVLSGMQNIVKDAPDYIEESLIPLKESLQKKHEPHIALLFAFLELFKHFQGNINELSKKHLDFFYEQVLKMIPKDAVPDMAHIVFEIANHQNEYLLKKDLLLKDGKDINKQDIQFGLDHEIVLDKAQVTDLRTLSLYPIKDNNKKFIEGVYIAPVANKADGKEKDFKDDQAKNWPTLGSKYSKCILEGNETPEEYPKARLGFVLASPVLLLEEGKRTINFLLDCTSIDEIALPIINIWQKLGGISVTKKVYNLSNAILEDFSSQLSAIPNKAKKYLNEFFNKISKNKIFKDDIIFNNKLDQLFLVKDPISGIDIFSTTTENKVRNFLASIELDVEVINESIFKLSFSGEKEWLIPDPENITIIVPPLAGNVMSLEIIVELKSDFPPIVFYNKESLKEKIDLKEIFPLVKIEIDDTKINCISEPDDTDDCCLEKEITGDGFFDVSIYHFLQKLVLADAMIDVKVCGVKNLIVQNDENLQDVNKPIFPFGPRPQVGEDWLIDGGANFYIGSKEIFCKDWQKFSIVTTWKDKPLDLHEHYRYYRTPEFENGDVAITEHSFRFLTSVLNEGNWMKDGVNIVVPNPPVDLSPGEPNIYKKDFGSEYTKEELLPLFEDDDEVPVACDNELNELTFRHSLIKDFFIGSGYSYEPKSMGSESLVPLTVNSKKGFVKLTLSGIDFQHDRFAFVLAKQMMALAELADSKSMEEAKFQAEQAVKLAAESITRIGNIDTWPDSLNDLQDEVAKFPFPAPPPIDIDRNVPNVLDPYGLLKIEQSLQNRVNIINTELENKATGLPKEPYTPLIKSLSIDYHAIATKKDLDIIHLYPYENTSKLEDVENSPTLFPYFDDEGILFIGIEKITKGGNLSMLFQLAEATADSELDRAKINWHYLRNNIWEPLDYDFDIISDETDGFTVSGITTIAVPDDINNIGNTVMPDPLYWIKVSAKENVKAVAEIIGIHTQAAKTSARFNELSDKSRLVNALESGSIAKLVEGDFNIKKAEQIYPSFGGRIPEANGHFYTRVSEHLKHKGRALMLNDYEKIVLEGFPEIYKAKCITHTMGLSAIDYKRDLEIAPGFVVVTVIPDLTKLKSGNLQEPKVPISLLEKIGDHIRKRTSTFARLKVMNPRFEYVDVSITVRLYRGKSENFYKQKLKEDIKLFLAPWSLGDSEKLAFGQVILFSDIVGFVEQLDYVDFIVSLDLSGTCGQTGSIIKPLTARSVLTGGIICVDINKEECPEDKECIDNQESLSMVN